MPTLEQIREMGRTARFQQAVAVGGYDCGTDETEEEEASQHKMPRRLESRTERINERATQVP